MEIPINHKMPTIMHLDLNSCFATAEQQANPLLRGKPMVVAAYNSPRGCVLAPSIEAKKLGIKVGMRVEDARFYCPKITVLTPDPAKYRDLHLKFCRLFRQYSPQVTPKSIDEAIIDFTHTPALKRGLVKVGQEIKKRMRLEIGDWIRCSIGISTNRFLAKLAACLHKPDGLDVISYKNLEQVYKQVKLTDLCGINLRFQARLNSYHIFTPLDFLKASLMTLKKQVFQSVCGYYWYLRLRGWEIDQVDSKRQSFGQSYALPQFLSDPKKLAPLIMKLCEKMGRRLRRAGFMAKGIHLACLYNDQTFWHQNHTFPVLLYSTQELYAKTLLLFNHQPQRKKITHLMVRCFGLVPTSSEQLELFYSPHTKLKKLSQAMDKVNNLFGEFTLIPARMLGLNKVVLDRIAFGGVKELEDLYASP